MKKWAKNLKSINSASSLKTIYSESTWTIFDPLAWLFYVKRFFLNCHFKVVINKFSQITLLKCVIFACNLCLCINYDLKTAIKKTLSKIKIKSHVDSKHVFESTIVQILSEKKTHLKLMWHLRF
jgi:hypothetical protein